MFIYVSLMCNNIYTYKKEVVNFVVYGHTNKELQEMTIKMHTE